MKFKITKVAGREILDSRGNPTCEADLELSDRSLGRAACPAGASRGRLEALELRDENPNRYLGKGVLRATSNINTIIARSINKRSFGSQAEFDQHLINLDGTADKSHLGANSILPVSMAFARACAASQNKPLFRYIADLAGVKPSLPTLMVNLIGGGAHADSKIDIQEFLIIPYRFKNLLEALRCASEVTHKLKLQLKTEGLGTNVSDEGAFSPKLDRDEQAIKLIVKAIKAAKYQVGKSVALGLDVAASELYSNGWYRQNDQNYRPLDWIKNIELLVKKYQIKSVEDPIAQDDWLAWEQITARLGHEIALIGDDLFVTNTQRIAQGIAKRSANAVLIKLNQIGTLWQTLEAISLTHKSGFKAVISHRSGETEDTFIAHLAVGAHASAIKSGAVQRSERLAKYNELIRISELDRSLEYQGGDLWTDLRL